MELRPEQQRALRYLEAKGTRASLESVRAAVVEAFRRIEDLVDSLDPSRAEDRPPDGGWSCLEIVDHLVETNRPATVQLRAALAGSSPGPAVPARLQSSDPSAKSWSRLLDELKQGQAEFVAALDQARDDLTAPKIPVAMVIKAANPDGSTETLDWVEELHWKAVAIAVKAHTLEHLAQIRRTSATPSPVTVSDLEEALGAGELVSDWLEVTQEMMDHFAAATLDDDWMHTDPERARREGPFDGTIAFGFWTTSMLTWFLRQATGRPYPPGVLWAFNYGFDRVRLLAPVPVGSRVRNRSRVVEVRQKAAGRFLVKTRNRVEIEGTETPAMLAEWLFLLVYPA